MTIQELINELEQYDKELEIHVYSITNDKDATISHIGRGDDENGMLETFVSICTEDTGVESDKPKASSNEPIINIKPNDYKQMMMDSASRYNAQEKAYQKKIASQKAYIHDMYVNVCNFVDYLCSDIPNMEITKNEGGKQSGNKIKVRNKVTGNSLTISTPHTYHYGNYTISFWLVRNKLGKGYEVDYDNFKAGISELMGHII